MEEQQKEKGAGTDGKGAGKAKGGEAAWEQRSEKGAESEGKGAGKGKGGGGDGDTGASGVSVLEAVTVAMSKEMFPDIPTADGRTRGIDRAYSFHSVPGGFPAEMELVCKLPEESLMKWFGNYNWGGLLNICVTPPDRAGGTFRVRCPVEGCNKEWTAGNVEDTIIKCDSLYDHLWQRAYVGYGRGAYGTRQKYPSPWW